LRRPKSGRKNPDKQRILAKDVPVDQIEAAANRARYALSDYHCKVNGKLSRRVKPATVCKRDFTFQEAGDAIRAAIRGRRVSRSWINGFPRHIWHKIGEVWYEGRTEAGTAGTYHAYPIDKSGLPPELQ
jgi:hypothetical protein